jgi:hypothetical protein
MANHIVFPSSRYCCLAVSLSRSRRNLADFYFSDANGITLRPLLYNTFVTFGLVSNTAPAPAAPGFGGFGGPAPAPAATGFGGFGAPAPAPSAFGAPAPAPT